MDKDAHKFFDPNPYIEKMNTYFNDKFEFDRQEVLNGKIYYMFRSKKQKIMIDRDNDMIDATHYVHLKRLGRLQ